MQVPAAILAIIEKYLNGTASPEEKKELYNWYHLTDQEELVVVGEDADTESTIEQRLGQRLYASLERLDAETMREKDVIPLVNARRSRFFIWSSVAAAILILLATGSFLFLRYDRGKDIVKTESHLPKSKTDIKPGSNKAILTLANGSKIVLDATQNGVLAQQGLVRIIKTNEGRIAYDVSRTAAAADQLPAYNTMTTPRGGQYTLILPDGSQVWLNAASSIRYPTSFSGSARKVEVTGEAYFEIATLYSKTGHDKVPFVVKINKDSGPGAEVEVLGTHFNINAYDDEPSTEITLLEGSIKMRKGDAAALLMPGQRATVRENRDLIDVVNDPEAISAIAWKEGRFEFNGNIKGIMRRIARWYDLDVVYEQGVSSKVFGGALPRQSEVTEVLKMLELTGSIHFKIEDRKVIVMK